MEHLTDIEMMLIEESIRANIDNYEALIFNTENRESIKYCSDKIKELKKLLDKIGWIWN